MSEWISVKDKMPKEGDEIMAYAPLGEFVSFKSVFQYQGTISPGITHWMPLPPAPK